MTLGSLFDGIGVWQLAAVRAGIKPVWSSEIDKFCTEVSRKHFPETVQLGDIRELESVPKVDVITASSPCQDISIAGKRSGIRGEQSGLFFKAVDLVRRSDAEFFVWENVPHVLSRREDFAAVLEEITQADVPIPEHFANAGCVDFDGGQLAWRIFDAQHFGVAQRRRRVFLVADFAGRRAAEILFEPASLSGDSSTAGQSKRDAPPRCTYGIDRATFNQGINAKFKPVIEHELQPTLTSRGAGAVCHLGVIRRLTPVECERLQGLPDDWTAYGSDSKRYKALGNALALPIATWILQRIKEFTT